MKLDIKISDGFKFEVGRFLGQLAVGGTAALLFLVLIVTYALVFK